MSVTKRLLFGREPELEPARRKLREQNWSYNSAFSYRLALRRRNVTHTEPRWDPSWPNCLFRAANQLNIEFVNINGGMFFRAREEMENVRNLAEVLWRKRIAARATERR